MTTININFDDAVYQQAAIILSTQGLSITEAIQLWITMVAKGESLPFNSKQPNTVTIAAMNEREEDLLSFTSINALMEHLRESN